MPRPESEKIDAAPPPPGYSTPTKLIRNDGAGHAESNAARMDTESEADVEKEFDESTGAQLCWSHSIPSCQAVDHRLASKVGG